MSRRPNHPLRPLTDLERQALLSISRSQMEPAAHVARAKELLAVSEGRSFSEAARRAGRKSGDAVAHLVVRFNQYGISALETRHGGGWKPLYSDEDRRRILQEAERAPRLETDGTLVWSLSTLRDALRRAPDGLPKVSTYMLWQVLHVAGYSWQRDHSWCPTGQVERKRKAGLVTVVDPDAEAKKLIETAYNCGEAMGLSIWCEDDAGPFQTIPYLGQSWTLQARRQPHEYVRNGTAKQLTLFHPASGRLRIEGVRSADNQTLHAFLKRELAAVLTELPEPAARSPEEHRQEWLRWQEGLTQQITFANELPRLRVLLIMDNLTGHRTPRFVLWLFAHGIMPLYTPLGGSWLNMAESIQRLIKRRALEGQHPRTPEAIIENLEAAARAWNRHSTPFEWGGKRQARRQRSCTLREHALGGSCAVARQSLRRSRTVLAHCQDAIQLTH